MTSTAAKSNLSLSRFAFSPFSWWLLLFPLLIVLWYYPVITFTMRAAAWLTGGLILVGSAYFCRRCKWASLGLGFLFGAVALFVAFSPSFSVDRDALSSSYCSALESYDGRPYVWGGESYSCIDCSGLVRKAFEDALTTRCLASGNAGLIRSALWLYWHDTNADHIGQGYDGQTQIITNRIDYTLIKPGDLCVLYGGHHVMAYLGDKV